MRVRTYHLHTINRGSPVTAALVTTNTAYSICFAVPVVLVSLYNRWHAGLGTGHLAWCAFIFLLWAAVELVRLYFGFVGCKRQDILSLIWFLVLTFLPQLPFLILYNVMWPQKDSLDHAVSITMLIMLLAEFLFTAKLITRLIRENNIEFLTQDVRDTQYVRNF